MKIINLPAGTTHVPFGELAHLIADAVWPDTGPGDDRIAYGGARVNFDDELSRAVDASLFHGMGANPLPVKDPLTLGPHTFPMGDALRTALVTVSDFRAFVAGRGIEVIVGAIGDKTLGDDLELQDFLAWRNSDYQDPPIATASQPKPREFCMLMDVSICIAKQEGWQNSVREKFLKKMMAAAAEGDLTVFDPEIRTTRLPKFGPNCPNEFTTPEDVNKWLRLKEGGHLTWTLDAPEHQTAPVVTESASMIHSTKARRNALTPVIELAQKQCRNPQDTAEVWGKLQVLANNKHAPFLRTADSGLDYLHKDTVKVFTRNALGKRLTVKRR